MTTDSIQSTTASQTKVLSADEARTICQNFALKHKVIFQDEGACGFGRECVGFNSGDKWIDHNPYSHGDSFEQIKEFACDAAEPPAGVNAYHKHNCLAVLGRGDEAVIQLAKWVQSMEAAGDVKIVEYKTGATGIQAMFSGVFARTVMITPRA